MYNDFGSSDIIPANFICSGKCSSAGQPMYDRTPNHNKITKNVTIFISHILALNQPLIPMIIHNKITPSSKNKTGKSKVFKFNFPSSL
jgi:hypothetical protein